MARRGDELREHILRAAKDVFLELGFERTSMDAVSARAETSKRSLYAHFESKERLFLAVIDLVRGLFLDRLGTPGDYSDEPGEAIVMFCGRYLESLFYEASVRMMRVSTAEAERFPEQATQYFDVLFLQVRGRLGTYLAASFALPDGDADARAERLLGQILYPRLPRALFGLDPLAKSLGRGRTPPSVDLTAIRTAVTELTGTLTGSTGVAGRRSVKRPVRRAI